MARAKETRDVTVDGHTVTVTSPTKVVFPAAGLTKWDLAEYYQAVAPGAVLGVRDRPMALKRFVKGITQPPFFQKRAPTNLPPFVRTATLSFPSGRTADEVVVSNTAALLWVVNLGCVDLNPHPTRDDDLEHPDELRIDLDPVRGVPWSQVREVALVCRSVLDDADLVGWPKTSGSRGIHIHVRIERRWDFAEVRKAAVAIAREVERRAPSLATSKWWKEERHGVFIDYNQNAKDRTVASAYSVRPLPDARVSAPLRWDEVADCDPADFTVRTMPGRFAALGDLGAGIDEGPAGSLEWLLELGERHEADGIGGEAPYPPQYAKADGEPTRVQPSRAKGSRVPKVPTVTVANHPDKAEALAGLARWKERHPSVAARLAEADILVDSMRGRSTTWTRIRVRLGAVPVDERPAQETPDPDVDPTRADRARWAAMRKGGRPGDGS
jgi:bifunctional non-homologous end joining protein LigD